MDTFRSFRVSGQGGSGVVELPVPSAAALDCTFLEFAGLAVEPARTPEAGSTPENAGTEPLLVVGVGRVALMTKTIARNTGFSSRLLGTIADLLRSGLLETRSPILLVVDFQLLCVEACRVLAKAVTKAGASVGIVPLTPDPSRALAEVVRFLALPWCQEYGEGTAVFDASEPDLDAMGFIGTVQRGVDLFAYSGHGNGADYSLGKHVICERASVNACTSIDGIGALPCQAGGPCLRPNGASYVGADSFRARLGVMLTCWGLAPADGTISYRNSFARALLGGRHVLGLLTTYTVVFLKKELMKAVLATLHQEGCSLGELAPCLNEVVGPVPPFLCFGDPRLRPLQQVGA